MNVSGMSGEGQVNVKSKSELDIGGRETFTPQFCAHLSVSLNVCVSFTTAIDQLYMHVSAPCSVFMLILRASLSESLSSLLTQPQRQICPAACVAIPHPKARSQKRVRF